MSILSVEFLVFIFLTLIVYYILPLKCRWLVLTAAGMVFVAFAGWYDLAYLGATVLLTWGGGLALNALRDKKQIIRRLVLALLLLIEIGAMAYIKYEPALVSWISSLGNGSFSIWELAAPLGLSYFTFQSAGLLIDIYRGKAAAKGNPLRVWLFTGYFLQLPQGPLSTYKDMDRQLNEGHRFDPDNLVSGFQLLLWGYFKKLVIADRLATTTQALMGEAGTDRGWFILMGVVIYTVRLYADFSGGMDAVRGISRMFGVELPINFKRPFFAVSVADYWRRWHITLGTWFRSYVMYPMVTSKAGVKVGKLASKLFGRKTGTVIPSAIATLTVFVLIGIWHMPTWNAVIYGAYFGIVMSASMLLEPVYKLVNKRLGIPKKGFISFFRMIRTWLMILPAQYFAFSTDTALSLRLIKGTFTGWSFTGFTELATGIMSGLEWAIAGAALVILLIVDIICEVSKKDICERLAKGSFLIRWPLLIILILIILVFGVYGEGFDGAAFMYTQF